MIPAWLILSFSKKTGKNCFDFNCKGTEVHVHGVLEDDDWVISVKVHIFGCTAYGYNRFHTGIKGSWKSVLLVILQQAVNQHGTFVGGKNELVEQMKVIWKSP